MLPRNEWLLLFLGAAGGPYPLDQIRIMKGMFLLDQTPGHPAGGLYRFEPFDFGPFDSRVYRDLDTLELARLVTVNRTPGSSRRTYELSDLGQRRCDALAAKTPDELLAPVRMAKCRVTSQAFEPLLREIYAEFPAFAVNSRARLLPV